MTYQKRTVRELKCAHCSSDFTASRFDAKYCSRSCAVLAKREAKRLEVITKPEPIQQQAEQAEEQKNPHLVFFGNTEWDLSTMDLEQTRKLLSRMQYHRHKREETARTEARVKELEELNRQQKLKDQVLGKSSRSKKPVKGKA